MWVTRVLTVDSPQLIVSCKNYPVEFITNILYFVIGDPFSSGASQAISALSATTLVIGAKGFLGAVATIIVSVLEYKESPVYEFLA